MGVRVREREGDLVFECAQDGKILVFASSSTAAFRQFKSGVGRRKIERRKKVFEVVRV